MAKCTQPAALVQGLVQAAIRSSATKEAVSELAALTGLSMEGSKIEDQAIGGIGDANDGEVRGCGAGQWCRAGQWRSRCQTQSPKMVPVVSSWRLDAFWTTWSSTKSAPIDHAPLKNPPEGAPIAEGQPVTHKPRTMSEAVGPRAGDTRRGGFGHLPLHCRDAVHGTGGHRMGC